MKTHLSRVGFLAVLLLLGGAASWASGAAENTQSDRTAAQDTKPKPAAAKLPDPKQLDGSEREDPSGVIYAVEIVDAKPAQFDLRPEPDGSRRSDVKLKKPIPKPDRTGPVDRNPDSRVNPLVWHAVSDVDPDQLLEVIVVFESKVGIPRFPEPGATERGAGGTDRRYSERREQIIKAIDTERRRDQGAVELLAQAKAEVLERFWLINGYRIRIAAGAIRKLAADRRVIAIDPTATNIPPPQDANNANDVDDGRAVIRSDPYFNLGLNSGFIGLLDTGVRETHVVFATPDNLDFLRDCVGGGADCNTGTITTTDLWPHGTASAAIISAGSGGGAAFRGVNDVTLDSFRVYGTANGMRGGLDVAAAVRGFQRAVAVGDRVIVGEIQLPSTNAFDALANAADAAFDSGAVVVSANGNNPDGGTSVSSPAIAHKSLGTGRTDLGTAGPHANSLQGPAPDGRLKPDVHAPSNTETARGSADNAFARFGGTSGATPYAAGAAALLRNWLRQFGAIDPGQVYAQMIIAGRRANAVNNTNGAGLLALPVNGWAWWGKTQISNRQTLDIPLNVGAGHVLFDAAIWWPEGGGFLSEPHSDIDIRLIDPSGTTRASGLMVNSVFERIQISGALTPGTWRLRIEGFNTHAPNRTVYWSAHVSRTPN